jgi:hypothetical protein
MISKDCYNKYWIVAIALIFSLMIPMTALSEDGLQATYNVINGADSKIDLVNNIQYTGAITAIGVKVNLPDGFEFVAASGDTPPALYPKSGDTGELEFAWLTPPGSPFTFICTVAGNGNVGDIKSEVIYRRDAGPLSQSIQPDL